MISRRMKLRLRRLTPLLVWVGVLLLATPLYFRQVGGGTVTGFAREVRYSVSPEAAGRLNRLEVKLNQDVIAGQIVASLEDDDVRLQLREARTELDRLARELGRERAMWELDAAGQQVDQQTNLRRFARDASDAHIEHLVAMADLAENRIKLQGLELTLGRTRQLVEEEHSSVATLDDDRIAYEALRDKITGQKKAVAAMFQAHRDAGDRYQEFLTGYLLDVPDTELLLKPLESGLKIQDIRIERVNLAISRCVLRAPVSGRVAEILHQTGEVVAAGQPVLTILDPRPTGVVAYLPENQILDLEPGTEVRLRRVADPRQSFPSSVSSLGASVDQMPLRVDPLAATPGWGLAVFVPLPESQDAKPGEAFLISF
jgi:multidrug resistance efflux pump